jgi:hypothetical protein
VRAKVLDVAGQLQLDGVLVHEGPKADPLYNAFHTDFCSCALIWLWSHSNQITAIRVAFYKRALN